MEKNTHTAGGIGFLEALTLVFIALKITGYIKWSWLWVLAPTWIPIVVVITVLIILLLIGFLGVKK